MNPIFDLTGPEFLFFYGVLAVALHALFGPLARAVAGGPGPGPAPIDLSAVDPYLVAYLRGKENETARVAILSLVDRGLLAAEGEQLEAIPGAAAQVRRPLERAVLEAFATKGAASGIFTNASFVAACTGVANELQRRGLAHDEAARSRVFLLRVGMASLLVAVALARLAVALYRGRHNVGFLIVLSIGAALYLFVRKPPFRTALGDSAIETLRSAFASLPARAEAIRPGGGSTELVLLASIFGLGALAGAHRTRAETLFPTAMKAAGTGNSDGGSGCGASSSCGSSSCSSGSSCSGGSCGGGGGCGGCGG